ncbi:MAG: hypothetical protein CFE26_06585 [Verrucomicrobiales bacterium VVV1]|nr:MAG: hypothetical protein CFE26_06585 [Verrucomicrobiales bacterium VVV1]
MLSPKSLPSKRIYRWGWSPLTDPNAKDLIEALKSQSSRVTADGVCSDGAVYSDLSKVIAELSNYIEQDFPFVGFCEHYLLTDGSSKGILIGFICEDHGVVVWQMKADDSGRWIKTASGTLRGTEADKAAIQSILSKTNFDPL